MALQLHGRIAALDTKFSCSPARIADDALHVGEASIVVPSIAVTTSPAWKPAAAAALSAWTLSTRAVVLGLPKKVNRPAKMTIASRKLAIGPAATIAARGATFL